MHIVDMQKHLQHAINTEFIHRDTGNPRMYMFNNGYFQTVAYSRLLFSQRTALHLQVAKHYEKLLESQPDCIEMEVLYPSLYSHWNSILEASVADKEIDQKALRKVIHYLKLMGGQAVQFTSDSASTHFQNALEKSNLFTDPVEKQRAVQELKLKIVGCQPKVNMIEAFRNFKKVESV